MGASNVVPKPCYVMLGFEVILEFADCFFLGAPMSFPMVFSVSPKVSYERPIVSVSKIHLRFPFSAMLLLSKVSLMSTRMLLCIWFWSPFGPWPLGASASVL